MKLKDVIGETTVMKSQLLDMELSGLTADSRDVDSGYLFAALPGTQMDGGQFIAQAIDKGAVAILSQPGAVDRWLAKPLRDDIALIEDANPRRQLALIAARFFNAQPDTVAAITGTNGKTSVASFVRQLWTQLGYRAASMGTLGVISPDGQEPLEHTTPDPVRVHQVLKRLAEDQVSYLALEASSHGLAQYRLDGVRINVAAFTNLTQDHLDYHEGLDDYLYTKLRLFGDLLPPRAIAVLNADADHFEDVDMLCWARGQRVVSVGKTAPEEGRHIHLAHHKLEAQGQRLTVMYEEQTYTIFLPLLGAFQASNALIAAGIVIACGAEAPSVFERLGTLQGVPGRMEKVGEAMSGAPVFVDYAHTPDAVRNVLTAARPHTQGRLHIIIGAGGDRDQAKRSLMGAAAAELADQVIVTDDNPRSEEPASIRAQVLQGAPGAKDIGDRAQAIEQAIVALEPGDLLVIAGKGHETGQIIGDVTHPFSDRDEARACLSRLGGQV